MALLRSIGRWGLTALIINAIVGSGIFGVPSELIRTVGRASPLAMILGGLGISVIVACFAEVASQFQEPGGVYLYARTAFGSFAGLQTGWFWWLSAMAGVATNANLFVTYLSGFSAWAGHGLGRALILSVLILIPMVANYRGIKTGLALSTTLTIAKLLPLLLLIGLGLSRFGTHIQVISLGEIKAPGGWAWIHAALLLVFAYSGFEDCMVPTGEMKNPRRTIPFALITALAVCIGLYTLVQFVVVATVGASHDEAVLATTASVLIGPKGATFVAVAAMVSTYGFISASMLNSSRFPFSLATKGEFPAFFGELHPRFQTPHTSLLIFFFISWLLAVTGTFRLTLAITAGSSIIYYGMVCLCLPRLRKIQPNVPALRLPFGMVFSIAGTIMALVLLSSLRPREVLLMSVTALIATLNWWWAKRRKSQFHPREISLDEAQSVGGAPS